MRSPRPQLLVRRWWLRIERHSKTAVFFSLFCRRCAAGVVDENGGVGCMLQDLPSWRQIVRGGWAGRPLWAVLVGRAPAKGGVGRPGARQRWCRSAGRPPKVASVSRAPAPGGIGRPGARPSVASVGRAPAPGGVGRPGARPRWRRPSGRPPKVAPPTKKAPRRAPESKRVEHERELHND